MVPQLLLGCNRNQQDPDIGDVGAGGAGLEQSIERLEEAVGIVVVEEAAGVETERRGAGERCGIGDRPGGIGGAVDAVGAGAQDGDGPGPGSSFSSARIAASTNS